MSDTLDASLKVLKAYRDDHRKKHGCRYYADEDIRCELCKAADVVLRGEQ
jgi:hypothetical protein